MNYSKPAIDINGQIALLKQRGLNIPDEQKAAHYLSNISYYRLRAYTYPFQNNLSPGQPFTTVINFDQIIQLYVFDRHLRLLIFDAIEKIEIALRTKIIYQYALVYGSHWHENQSLYSNHYRFTKDINKLYEEVDRSPETFIKHYKTKYTSPQYPPAWMSLEVASMGLLSKLFENLKAGPEKKQISREFGLGHPKVLESWIHALAQLRNICAHHGRVWNRRLTTIPLIPNVTQFPFLHNRTFHANKIYGLLCCITYILKIISPANTFNSQLKEVLRSCNLVECKEMGFPQDWEKEQIWA